MASYVVVPKTLNIKEIENNKLILAPSRYSKFVPENRSNFISLKNCVISSNKRKKIKPNKKYYYLEIGDINVNSGYPSYKLEWGYKLPSTNPKELKQGDIVVSMVRTYRKGIGFIDNDKENIVGTSAFLVIRKIKNNMFSKEYLFSILRHDFFIEQILSLQNRGMYPRIDKDNLHLIFIPNPRNKNEHDYITILTKAIINKEKEIRKKHNLILEKIEKELLENQKPNKFEYKLPDIKEIESKTRIDTGIYSENFKHIDFIIKNYIHGFYFIDKEKIFGGSTPKKRIISKKNNLKYKWITPTQISDYGHLVNLETISMPTKNNLNQSAMLLINRTSKGGRGEYVGIAMFYDFSLLGNGHHNQGIYRVVDYPIQQLQFMTAFINSKLMREYCANLSVGSKMKEIKINQFLTIPFPNFPESKQKEIAELYYNPVDYPTDLNLDNFLEEDTKWNEKAGILQLDLSAKKLKERLNEVIHQIVMDEEVQIDFIIK